MSNRDIWKNFGNKPYFFTKICIFHSVGVYKLGRKQNTLNSWFIFSKSELIYISLIPSGILCIEERTLIYYEHRQFRIFNTWKK